MTKLLLLFVLFISLLPAQLLSQTKIFSIAERKLSLNNELSQGRVGTIIEDERGVIWIGTLDGLNSFDGYKVKIYHHQINDTSSLSSSIINSLAADNKGGIWIGTDNGLNYYSIYNNSFTRFFEKNEYLVEHNANKINEVIVDKDGFLWYATAGVGVVKYNTKTQERQYITNDIDVKAELNQDMNHIAIDNDGSVWFTNGLGEIGKIDTSEMKLETYKIAGSIHPGISRHWTSEIFIDQNNRKYFLLNGKYVGLFYFDENDRIVREDDRFNKQIESFNFSSSLHSLGAITNDNEGNLWLSSMYQGIFKLDKNYNITYYVDYLHDYSKPERFMQSGILTLFFSRTGTMWYGLNGYGLGYINNFDFAFNTIKKNKDNIDFVTRSVRGFEEDDEKIWVCGYYGLVSIDKKTRQITKEQEGASIYSICNNAANKNELFIGSEGAGLLVFNKKTKKISDFIKKPLVDVNDGSINIFELSNQGDSILWIGREIGLQKFNYKTGDLEYIRFDFSKGDGPIKTRAIISSFIDNKDNVWFGSRVQGLWKYDPDKNIMVEQKIKLRKSNNKPLRINCINQDSRGYYWLSTDIGLFVSKEMDGEFRHFTVTEGLPNDFVYASLEDGYGNIWLSTNNGLSSWDIKDSLFINYDISSGIQNKEFNTGAYFKDSNGYLYFGGIDGLTYFNPEYRRTIDKNYEFPLIFTRLNSPNGDLRARIDSESNYTLNLKTSAEFLNIEFSLLSYLLPDQNFYQYRNLKTGGNWINIGNNTKIFLNQPSTGKQTIEIRAGVKGKDNFNNTIRLTIIKEPYIWQTWYFWTVVGLLLIVIMVLLVRRKIWKSKQEKRKLATMVGIKTKELNEAIHELSESNATKDRLFSIIAHDLRNPLNSLLGFSSLLESQGDFFSDEEKKEFVSIIHMSSKNLNNLLDNLLNWSRLQMKKIKPRFQMLDMKSIIDSNLTFLTSNITQKKIEIVVEGLMGVNVYSDPDMVSVIVRNLLSNAVKFTHEGGKIIISIEQEGKYYKLSILDNGVGIDDKTIDILFETKVNNSSHGTNNEVGTGLGLLLCNDFAKLINGKLTVQSTPEKGSCFCLYMLAKE